MNPVPPKVSAVIPTRNRPALVERAVRSVLAQTSGDVEAVVVIDGPDLETVAALTRMGDDRIVIVALQENVGGSEARNVGARAARGKWVALLDDDDEWLPNKIERQLAVAESAGDDRVVVACQFISRYPGTPDVIRPRRLPAPGEPACEYMFDFLCYFQTSTLFCSRSLFLESPFQKGLKAFQDMDWFLRVNLRPNVRLMVIPEPLSIYYAPEDRASITKKLGWEVRLAWGQERRGLMTGRAYSRFIAGSCVGRAVEDRAGFPALRKLMYECVVKGSATPGQVMLLLGTFFVSPGIRRRVRDLFFLSSAKAAH